jgi:hypothetical protein
MSRKYVGCSNYNLQHDTSQKPSEFPTTILTVNPSIYQVGVASSCPLLTIEGAETLYTYKNKS